MEICDILKAEIVDMSKSYMMIQICAEPEKIKLLLQMMNSISVVEVARTGTLALTKCSENE
jgi:acetolactate synthase-1/3 small subunit